MKKVILVLNLLIFGIIGSAQNQLLGVYYVENINDKQNMDCYLRFYKGGCYELELYERISVERGEGLTLSQGRYYNRNNTLLLIDTIYDFEIQLQVYAFNDLRSQKNFAFLQKAFFTFLHENYESDCKKYGIDTVRQKQERQSYHEAHKTKYPLYYGTYDEEGYIPNRWGYNITGYELRIDKDHQYSLYYKRVLLSQGEWKREGNELSLFDKHLQHPYYVMIGEKGLISRYLPGEYRGCSLHLRR